VSPSKTHSSRVVSIASGTLASRLTGLLRVLVLAWVLGFTPLADAFNLANTVPNMLFDLVLGGVMSATFIPVFVERLALDGERKAWRSISSVVTGALLALLLASVASWVAAPLIIKSFTLLQHSGSTVASATMTHQRAVATELLRWFVPQVFFYGLIGIATALLNVRRRFGAPAWVPVVNNFVCIAVLVWFHLVDPSPTVASVQGTRHLLYLGLGTSLGVGLQFLALLPSLARADLWRMTFRLDLRDPAVKAVTRLGSWTLLVVIANQASLYVVLAFAFGVGGSGPVSAYTYGWSFMQLPYAVVVVSVLSALTPQLSAFATQKNFAALAERLRFGLRQSLVIIIPCTFVLIILAQPIVATLLNHLNATHRLSAAVVLAILAAGLPGFTVFQLVIRGLQAMQRARTVFVLYALENALTIGLCFVLGRHSLAGLTASVSLAYGAAAIVALITIGRLDVPLAPALWSVHVQRSLFASGLATLAMAASYAGPAWNQGLGLVARLAGALVAGLIVYALVVLVLARRVARASRNGARL